MDVLGLTFHHVDTALLGALALPLLAAHKWGDHALQSSYVAATKGQHSSDGRRACSAHALQIVAYQAVAVGATLAVTGLDPALYATITGLAFTLWSHYWADRRVTLAGLWAALNKDEFAQLGAPRPGRDDNPSLGTGAYQMDQDWHLGWLAVSAVLMASSGATFLVLALLAAGFMAVCIAASRHGRRMTTTITWQCTACQTYNTAHVKVVRTWTTGPAPVCEVCHYDQDGRDTRV